MRSTSYTYQFKLLVGQEYELEKKLTPPNPKGRNQYSEVRPQNGGQPKTADRLAKEQGVMRKVNRYH